MKLKVNAEDFETTAGNVRELLDDLDIQPERVAVELNLKIIKRCDFESTKIAEGDAVEIVSFVGGG